MMAQQILVIEYEPRYIQRIEEAATSGGFSTTVARTGDEAIQALPGRKYDLIVLSTIIPRYSTAQLIRSIRADSNNASTPVLLTTSGYSGTDPRSDAVKLGASDMLVKPYAPPDFIQKVKSVLKLPADTPTRELQAVEPDLADTVRLSSEQIFGDLLDDTGKGRTVQQPRPADPEKTEPIQKIQMQPDDELPSDRVSESTGPEPHPPEESPKTAERKKRSAPDVDKMLADTLAGVRVPASRKKRRTTAAEDIDKMLENTLSGLETPRTKESPAPEAARQEPPPLIEQEPRPPIENEASESVVEQEEEPFPEALPEAEAEDQPPFDDVEERPDPDAAVGTRLIGGELPPEEEPEPEEPEPEEDTSRFGQYVLLEKIATGGMAEVWKARMRGLEGFEKIVAIKKILPHLSDNDEFTEMFVDEAKLAAQLNHNNIIHIYDLGKIDQSWFIAMEYIDGFDLKSLLGRGREVGRPLPIPLGLFIASKIASALDYAHRKKGFDDQELGLVHRDVSPQNVLISRDGDIKLCDFGIAKAATKASHTQAGALKGKLQYMSPEQAWGRNIDHRSDIFATAAVLFEMLAGRKLFSGDSELSVLDQVREAQVPSPSVYNGQIPPEVDEIVLKGLEKDPAARYQTAGEMARAIDSILYGYKPAPTSADLTLYVDAIEQPDEHSMPAIAAAIAPPPRQQEPEPMADEKPEAPTGVVPLPIPPVEMAPESNEAVAEADETETARAPVFGASAFSDEAPKKSRVVPIAIVVILILVTAGVGAVMMMRRGEPGGPQTDAAAGMGANPPAAVAPETDRGTPTEPAIVEALTEDQLAEEQLTEAPTGTALGEEDLALIDQAVRDRIEAERRRLERERQQQSRANESQPEPARRQESPPPSPQPVTTNEPAAEQTEPPARAADPAPVEPPPATTTAVAPSQPPEQPPAAPAKAAVKRGDLVQPGTPGLKEPQIVSLRRIAYPPLARRNKVEGLVIVRALISEDGKVLETELLRGVSPNVGLNEAAIEMVRGGKFQAASLDGVAVRSWKTIPIPFKME